MKNRLDEVFSVERLRRTWEGTAEPAQATSSEGTGEIPVQQDAGAAAAEAAVQRLREIIGRCFTPRCLTAMAPLLSQLEQLLKQRFPEDPSAALPREERAKLSMTVDGLLNQIEDLLEAFEVGSR